MTTQQVILWFLGLALPPLITVILEYRFGIVGRLKKIWYWTMNKNAGFEINLTFKKQKDFEKIKKDFMEVVRSKFGKAPVKKDITTKLEVLTDNYLTTINHLPNQEVFISTTRVECGIRELKNKLADFLSILQQLKKQTNLDSKEISFKIFFPFKWSYINVRVPNNLELKDYDIKFNENKFNSVINLKMNSLSITGDETALSYVLENFISIF